ncbi:hypothetical protein J5754_00420 [bacterium]|nr:hypothetical protein [bacterium]
MSKSYLSNDPSQTNPWQEWIKKKGWDKTVHSKPQVWDLLTPKTEAEMIAHKRALRLIEESRKAEVENALAKMYFDAQVKKALQRKSGTGNNCWYGAQSKTAAELGRKAGEAAAPRRTMPTSSPRYGSIYGKNETLNLSKAPRPSNSYLRAPQLRPASYYQPRPTLTAEPRYLVIDDFANLAKTGYYTAQFLGDWTDDLFHKAHTAAGKTLGILAADALGKMAGAQKTDWSKEDYLGGVWYRKPMAGRGLGAYLEAKRKGEDPSEWFAHAEDADFLYDYEPETIAGAIGKGLAVSAFNMTSPSQLAKAKLLEALNPKLAKGFKDVASQKTFSEFLGTIESWEDFANKCLKYR